jgi:SAM-dependent methyltransferase
VLDIGCGVGTWLRAAKDLGAEKVVGVDGDYVDRAALEIDPGEFVAHDLTQPLTGKGRFDLAISMEVGEHLPGASAAVLVATLVAHADVVLFSAAIPHQGGTDHINEQWPDYWANLFAGHGYRLVDWTRQRLWNNEAIAYYYRQNGFLYVRDERLADFPEFAAAELPPDHWSLRTVHPTKWEEANDPRRTRLRFVLQALPRATATTLKNRVARVLGRGF